MSFQMRLSPLSLFEALGQLAGRSSLSFYQLSELFSYLVNSSLFSSPQPLDQMTSERAAATEVEHKKRAVLSSTGGTRAGGGSAGGLLPTYIFTDSPLCCYPYTLHVKLHTTFNLRLSFTYSCTLTVYILYIFLFSSHSMIL